MTSAFGIGQMAFSQWLEHILCPRLRDIAAGRSDPPGESHVATMAVREFDGYDDHDGLIDALVDLDSL